MFDEVIQERYRNIYTYESAQRYMNALIVSSCIIAIRLSSVAGTP